MIQHHEYDCLNQLTTETFVKQSENINASMASEVHIAGQQERMILPESYSRKYIYEQAGNRIRMENGQVFI